MWKRFMGITLIGLLAFAMLALPAQAIESICGEDVQTGEIVVFFFNPSTGEIVGEIRCSPDQCSCS